MNNTTALSTAFYLTLVLLPFLACSCPFEIFSCQGKYSNTNVTQCNAHKIRCRNSTLWVLFFGKGHWYEARNITFPEKTFKLLDPWLASKLHKSRECDFLYNFTIPIRRFYPPTYRLPNHFHTLFNCTMNSYDFTRDIFERRYGFSHCRSYELFYTHRPWDHSDDNGSCSSTGGEASVEWKLSYTEGKGGDLEFSLMSLAFTHGRAASPECFGCVMREGRCSAAATSSECSCNIGCHIGKTRKILIALGSLAAGFLLALLAFYLWHRRGQRQTRSISRDLLFQSRSADFSADQDPEALAHSFFHTPIFPYEELEVATGGFDSSKELGDGGFGVVYKGNLKDGRVVAVKRLHERNYRHVQQFRNEVAILSRIRHPNLVSLYGCTSTQDSHQLLLVYEYVPNGTLADHLHGSRASDRLLTWPLRLSIAVETAAALTYLHASEPQIIHRDVKTSNILLDNDFHVKVADFGLSRQFPSLMVTHVSTAPQGTPGYVDPEYHQCYQLTDKSDVYSFGVVLIELLSSMPAVDMGRPRSEINLSNMAMARIPKGMLHDLVDHSLGFDTEPEVKRTMEAVAELAFRCLQPEKDMRPSMDEVRDTLVLMHGEDHETSVSPLREKQMKDDTCLLTSSKVTLSPDTVVADWASRSTTPNASS